jgi:hypothetical protein
MTPEPPMIAHLKGYRLEGLFVICANAACQHWTPLSPHRSSMTTLRFRRSTGAGASCACDAVDGL